MDYRRVARYFIFPAVAALLSGLILGNSARRTSELTSELNAEETSPRPIELVQNSGKAALKLQGEWGTLSGRFIYDGPIPEPVPISVNKDEEYCSKDKPYDESLIVNKENSGIANVVVRLEVKTGDKIPVHDSYRESATARVPLDNKSCRFVPHVCLLRTTQTLVITNSDDVSHNTAAYLDRNDPFNEVTAVRQSTEKTIARPERMPAKVNCSIHPWMAGWLVVSDHPYAAVSDPDGRFQIENLPAGEWTFQVWQEKGGWIRKAKQEGKPVEWKRGRVTIKIEPGKNSLGEIRLSPDAFTGEE
ncbi:MAG: hypothetical protein AB7O26_18210 [Planctomycetaceae bacterium]